MRTIEHTTLFNAAIADVVHAVEQMGEFWIADEFRAKIGVIGKSKKPYNLYRWN